MVNEAHKKRVKAQYDKSIEPRVFNEGDLKMTYDQRHDNLRKGKFESVWCRPFNISKVLEKGAYELMNYGRVPFRKPCNGLYLKMYYA